MKTIYKFILTIYAITLLLSYNIAYASMADFTDEEADKITKQNQEEWKQEQEERIEKSSNNYLKNLSVENYEITPEFDKQTINYEISKEITEDYIEIIAKTDDDKSSVSGDGKITLNSGENNIRIDVTAENGTVRTYFIKVNCINEKAKIEDTESLNEEDDSNVDYLTEYNKMQKQNLYKKIAIIIGTILVIIIGIMLIINKKKHRTVGKHG